MARRSNCRVAGGVSPHCKVCSQPLTSGVCLSTFCAMQYSLTQFCMTLSDCSSPGSSVLGDSPGKNTGVGCHALIFPTQGLNPGLLHCRQILSCLSHQGSPRILEWVAYPCSRGSSPSRNRTGFPALQTDYLRSELSF